MLRRGILYGVGVVVSVSSVNAIFSGDARAGGIATAIRSAATGVKDAWNKAFAHTGDAASWIRDKWTETFEATKVYWRDMAQPDWWSSCDICAMVPSFGQTSCSNVCKMLRNNYQKERPTKYPIVLLHGLVRMPIGRYFFGVKEFLEKHGFQVFQPTMSSFNTPFQHVRFLIPYIRGVLKLTGAPKVNLIGHSQGGLDARAVAALGGARMVASVTALQSPHRGSYTADDMVEKLDKWGWLGRKLVEGLLKVMYPGVDGGENGNWDSVRQLTTKSMARFNQQVRDQPGVQYFSYSGSSHPKDCPKKDNNVLRNVLQSGLVDSWKVNYQRGGDVHNDGQVHHDSARWGMYLGDLTADHWDTGGLPFGLNDFDYLDFFLRHARSLRDRGF